MRRVLTLALCVSLGILSLALVGSASAAPIPGQYIVVLKDGVDSKAVAAEHGQRYGAQVFEIYEHAIRGYAATLSPTALAAVKSDPRVLFVSADRSVTLAATCSEAAGPPTSVQCVPTHVDRIDGDLSSTLSGNGSGSVPVDVAVIDTGIDRTHPDLNVLGGVGCQKGAPREKNRKWEDPFGHGTHVAGIIGARDNGIGVVGVAPGARLWAARIFDKKGLASDSAAVCAVDWVTSTRRDKDPTNDIDVVNMSIGDDQGSDDGNCGSTNRDAVHRAICRSVAVGISYVAAAGNDGQDFANTTPAAYDEVLTATAMTDFDGQPGALGTQLFPSFCGPFAEEFSLQDDSAVFFSNFATAPADQGHTLAAPGVCIVSTIPGGQYGISDGTSHSAPQAAGTAALCIASGACAGLTPAQIILKLVSDAAAYNTANPGYGFAGDPLRPQEGKYYGYLIRAGLY